MKQSIQTKFLVYVWSTLILASKGKMVPLYDDDGHEPPQNPFLANSTWPMTHRNSYCQASSPWAGPSPGDDMQIDFLRTYTGNVALAFSEDIEPETGNFVMWMNIPTRTGKIVAESNKLRKLDIKRSGWSIEAISTAYQVLDKDGVFFGSRETSLRSFADVIPGDSFSGVQQIAEYNLEDSSVLKNDSDILVGMGMTYDGFLVFTTRFGVVGIISRNFTDLQAIQLGDGDEEISNSLSIDEDGGIYVVTSKYMHRVQWDGTILNVAWSSTYETGSYGDTAVGRLGPGSGSTPTLMGTRADDDKFVVITDGQELMHLVLFWRDKIPDDWTPIAPGKDIRIAAEVPITFGNPSTTKSVSEQSVLVRGYGAAVVNNDYKLDRFQQWKMPTWISRFFLQGVVTITNIPGIAPFGVEKFEWDPFTRTMVSKWVNQDVSCPNGIPTMSVATNLMYCVGQRFMGWTLEALDWNSGDSVFRKQVGFMSKFNSAYAGAQIGPDRSITTGALGGIWRARVVS